jgi:PKD repeat protein
MKKLLLCGLLLLAFTGLITTATAQSMPGDSVVFGPMFSPVYHDSVRVWVLTKTNTGSGDVFTLDVTAGSSPGAPLNGTVYNSDDRLGYRLRSFIYANLTPGETYTAVVKKNGIATNRVASIKNEAAIIDDFMFLAGGCGRIYDTSRCIDRPESQTHTNGDPVIFNRMAEEKSDLMIWLGDATYLLGLQHAMGQCPNGVDDWANKDMAFARYMFYRKFHDSLTRAMPQLAITDNHDTGPNEFNKTMPTLGEMKEIFMDWWPNPAYNSTSEGQGLFSSYKYKDVEFFLLDNRSYRDGTQQHLGPEQLAWLKQSLLQSTAVFKVLISGTPVFDKSWGGRNFSITAQGDELIAFIKNNNIDGVLSFSADIHEQEIYGRYADGKYPFFDIISGNLNSDVGSGQYTIDYNSERMLRGVKQTYMRVNVFGNSGDRRMKIAFVGLNGQPYFETIIHSDMLRSVDDSTKKLSLHFTGSLKDSSSYDNLLKSGSVTYESDRNGNAQSAGRFTATTALQYPYAQAIDLNDRAFSIGYWVNPAQFSTGNNAVLSNATATTGITVGFNKNGYPQYTDHKTGTTYTATRNVVINKWTYIVWKYDNTKKQLSLYYNGWSIQTFTGVATPSSSVADLAIGSDFNNNHYTGLLDDVIVFGKLISDSRILETSGYSSHRAGALRVAGASQMVIPSSLINTALANDFTIEFWGKLNADPGTNYKILASNGRVNNNTTGISFEFPDNNKMNIVLGTNTGSWNSITDKGSVWNIGEWNHVAVSATKNGKLIYYVNGEKIGETAFTSYAPNTFGLALGYSTYYGGSAVQAELDEFRIWNRALVQDSIRKHLHYPLTGSESGLQFYYDFEKHTDTSIISKGAQPYEILLKGGALVSATGPVADISAGYQSAVTANWGRGNAANAGLTYTDAVTQYTSNIVTGKNADNTLATAAGDSIYYLKGGWQIDPLNITFASIKIDLGVALPKADSIRKKASQYYLLQQTANDSLIAIAAGNFDGQNVTFLNTYLEKGNYYLGWAVDSIRPVTATFQVSAGTDDAEQDLTAGNMNLTSSDLELTKDGTSNQLLGVRFTGVNIPQGAVITNAYMQFTVDEVNTTGDVNVLIGVENTDNPLTMATFDFDIYHRIMNYGDTLIWKPGPFAVVGNAGTDQRTPDLAKLLQTIVNRPNWKAGNAVLFTMIDPAAANIPGYTANTAKRVAQAYENNPANAAKLVVTYVVPNRYQNGTFPIAKKASWKYNDSATDLSNTNWTAENYNDSSWAFGNAILGYGDGNETTTLNYGNDANNKRITYYLRNTFTVDDRTKYDSLVFDVLRDDGAIVYVNGTEAFRMNMPAGNVTGSTLATTAVNTPDETTYFRTKTANLLKNGANVIAVELHQSAVNSSDLSFDMEVGFTEPPLPPAAFPLTKSSYWHYLDKGISLDTIAWKDTTYNDRDWATGQGPLGYGDPMTTTISYGTDANNKYVTTYFRRAMTIDTAALPDSVEIGIRRDDGVLLYINGNEVIRDNMPTGAITYQTLSASTIDGAAESIYYIFKLPKTIFRQGKNQLAAEVHNRSLNSSDLGFDCYIKEATVPNPPVTCNGKHIACFTSIVPTGQTNKLIMPVEHQFQLIFKQGDAYTNGAGTVPGNHDFTAYLPDNGSSVLGRLSVNHENSPGGVSMLKIHYNDSSKLWNTDSSQPVDFYNNNLVTTTRNCSGGITPWGTVITSEESLNGGDVNGDGYEDVGWNVEIDPVTAKVVDYDHDGKQDKLWVMGRMNHENVVVAADHKTVYYGEDGGTHCMYKFVADVPGNLSAGKVYVLSLDQPLVNDDPSGSTANWVLVPSATQYDRNNMSSIAASLGGTNFNGVEDCEISPVDGKIYFTSKGKGRVYRFTDKGNTADNFETFVGGMSYQIQTPQGTFTEAWSDGNDNLTFDDKGNLWVLQDGGNYYIWVVRPDHTQSDPKVELFASFPAGSEPTGLTFSPDHRFGFVSVQHPSGSNAAQKDATLNNVTFDRSATIVFALKENLGVQKPVAGFKADTTIVVAGRSVVFTDTSKNYPTARTWVFEGGSPATSTNVRETVTYNNAGKYKVKLQVSNVAGVDSAVYTDYIEVIAPAPVAAFTADKVQIKKGEQVTFTDVSTNHPVSRKWTFSGGTPATAVDSMPIIVYNTAGEYDVTLEVANRAGSNTITKTKYIVVSEVTGLNDPDDLDQHLKMYPNPTSGLLTVEFILTAGKQITLELFDFTGKKLADLETVRGTGATQKLNFSIEPFVKNSQPVILLIRSNNRLSRRLLFFAK